jgi:hypothetical protein
VRSRLHVDTKAPLIVGGLIGFPLYFAALLASSLKLDAPRIVRHHEVPASAALEGKIWAAALIAPAILVGVGLVCLLLRRWGIYPVAVVGIVVCLVLPGISHRWIAGHTARFPLGVDLVKDSDPSNLASRGEWEKSAQTTIVSITHWTLGLCIGVFVIGALVEWRRRRGAVPIGVTPAAVTGEPEMSPVLDLELADSDLVRGQRPGRWRGGSPGR